MNRIILCACLMLTLPMAAIGDEAKNGKKEAAKKQVVDHKAELKQRIAKLNTFEAGFAQTVIDVDGKVLFKGDGKVQMSHPSLFRWHALTPNENLMVSDGKTLWIYDIDLEQVTATDAATAIESTPFALLASKDDNLWQNYRVEKHSDDWVIAPLNGQSQVKKLTLSFDGKVFSQLLIEDLSGQKSTYDFSKAKANAKLTRDLFSFSVPEGVDLDDQRQ